MDTMANNPTLASLVATVVDEQDCDFALNSLTKHVLQLSRSRNAMIARMNDELGTVELRYGAGKDWALSAYTEHIPIAESGQGIIAYVAATGASYICDDVTQEPKYRNLFGSQSEIAVPVFDKYKRIRAVVNVESDRKSNYTDDDLLLCETVARLASLALEREAMERRVEALMTIGSALDRALTEEELIDQVLKVAGEVLRFQAVSIFLFDAQKELFMLKGSVGRLKDKVGEVGYQADEGVTGWVCTHGESVLLNDPQNDPRWKARHVEMPGEQVASFIAVPVIVRGKPVGAIRVLRKESDNKYLDNRFTEDDLLLLQSIADQVASGLDNIRSVEKVIRIERMAAWGELSAKSSHMMGNRVFAIKGDVNELGHLLEEHPLPEEQLKAIQQSLMTNVTRIEEILQDFRDFVTATQLATEETALNPLVKESVAEVFPRRGPITLKYQLAEGLPQVMIDPRKLRRAISELVENSLNFFSEGTLSVTTSLATMEQIQRSKLKKTKSYVAVSVEDQGPGVSEDRKERIFEPFHSSRVKGMGLGLSIVKGIAEAHGGTVIEEGTEGSGARFVILLPVAERL